MKQDKNIDKIIKQNLSLENPSSDFSVNLMQQILDKETEKEKALSSLIQKHVIEIPSAKFTFRIMQEITANASSHIPTYQPVISKKIWFVLSSIILFVVVFTILNFDNAPPEYNYLQDFISKINGASSIKLPFILTSPIFALSLFALSSLLLLDRFLHRKEQV